MKKHSTKNALLMSAMSLLLCVSMLVGSTYAWFTDEVKSANNTITAGNLDVEVYYGDAADENSILDVDTLFNDVELWEPGAVAYENITVVNKGNLAFKYRLAIAFSNENRTVEGDYGLSQILKVALVEGGLEDGLTRDETLAKVTEWKPMEDFAQTGELLANTDTAIDTDTYGIVVYWEPTADDDNWNLNNGKETDDGLEYLHIDLGISVLATQLMNEEDSFGNTYDEDARFPSLGGTTLNQNVENHEFIVEIPAGTLEPADKYELEVSGFVFDNDGKEAFLRFDMKLMDGDEEANLGVGEYPVAVQLPHPFVNMENFKVYHKGTLIEDATYDEATRTVHFVTDGFSPFEIKYEDYVDPSFELEYKEEDGKYLITKGMFFANPAAKFEDKLSVDEKSVSVDPDCIAVDFTKDGVTYFVVSNRATSIFVSPDATVQYAGENETFDASSVDFRASQSGKLYSLFSGLVNNEHNTVYLLPGTYTEGTTIYLVSSVDVIGLGDTNAVKVVKPAGTSKSNRHLFNANGSKADYIQVTLRNMCLDVQGMNAENKDNAAVQSIRKSKVKCYDLNIIKNNPNNAGMIALYVNGNNAVDGVKYTAYLYVENCTLDTTKSFAVVSTSGSHKFYHTDLTYGGSEYTQNSGSVKNVKLAASDWDW